MTYSRKQPLGWDTNCPLASWPITIFLMTNPRRTATTNRALTIGAISDIARFSFPLVSLLSMSLFLSRSILSGHRIGSIHSHSFKAFLSLPASNLARVIPIVSQD